MIILKRFKHSFGSSLILLCWFTKSNDFWKKSTEKSGITFMALTFFFVNRYRSDFTWFPIKKFCFVFWFYCMLQTVIHKSYQQYYMATNCNRAWILEYLTEWD